MGILEEAGAIVSSLWPDDIPREEIADAVRNTEGNDHEILSINEQAVGKKFPAGTRYFVVES